MMNQVASYESFLSDLAATTGILAAEDILNDQGAVVAKSGTKFNSNSLAKICSFKLLKPLEHSISLETQLTPKGLYEDLKIAVAKDRCLVSLHKKYGNIKHIQKACLLLGNFPLVMQKLTVMKLELPEVYECGLVAAEFLSLLKTYQACDEKVIVEAFVAGLVHDIGLLHIEKTVAEVNRSFNAEEVRKLHSHPLVGFQILSATRGFPKTIAIAVRDHHEVADGSGYPKAKMRGNLDAFTLDLIFAVEIIEIYLATLRPTGVKFSQLLSTVRTLQHRHSSDIITAAYGILKDIDVQSAELPCAAVTSSVKEYLLKLIEYTNAICDCVQEALDAIGFDHEERKIHGIQNLGLSVVLASHSAGLTNELVTACSYESEHYAQECIEIRDLLLAIEEILRQANYFRKKCIHFARSHPSNPLAKAISSGVQGFKLNARPAPAKDLADFFAGI